MLDFAKNNICGNIKNADFWLYTDDDKVIWLKLRDMKGFNMAFYQEIEDVYGAMGSTPITSISSDTEYSLYFKAEKCEIGSEGFKFKDELKEN